MTENISLSVKQYADHLEQVYKMETFFGDSVLEGLLKHTKDLEEELTASSEALGDLFGKEVIYENEESEEEANDA